MTTTIPIKQEILVFQAKSSVTFAETLHRTRAVNYVTIPLQNATIVSTVSSRTTGKIVLVKAGTGGLCGEKPLRLGDRMSKIVFILCAEAFTWNGPC